MRNIIRFLFRRIVIVSLLLLMQFVVLFLLLSRFAEFAPWYGVIMTAASLLLSIVIVSQDRDPAYKIAWIIPILSVPLFGVTLYLILNGNVNSRRQHRSMRRMEHVMHEMLLQDDHILDELQSESSMAAAQAHYLVTSAGCPVYRSTKTDYFPSGETCFARMLEAVEQAQHYIYLEYFIIQPGLLWDQMLAALERKAAQGVTVRILYDDFGCITKIPSGYFRRLNEKGLCCRAFNPFLPVVSPRLNNRDHRKLLIVDGRIGFTGGMNLADEYINEVTLHGHWKDAGIRLEGDAVWSMTVMFLSMWDCVTHELPDCLPTAAEPPETAGYVQPFTDGPLTGECVSAAVFLNMISRAQKSVYIMTPYLILNSAMQSALCVAAKSGVDIRIITPGIPDKRYVYAVTRANYRELLDAGVRIYEYAPGFIHSKVICVDMEYAVVGTINMDFRSLYLHFEDGVFLYRTDSVHQVMDDFTDTLPLCREILPERYRERSLLTRAVETALRVFAPLM